jgi:hypothetical protein
MTKKENRRAGDAAAQLNLQFGRIEPLQHSQDSPAPQAIPACSGHSKTADCGGSRPHEKANAADRPPASEVRARQNEIALRYGRQRAQSSKAQRIQSIRRSQVMRLLQGRHGRDLPNDSVGRGALQLLLELGSSAPDAQRLAPWISGDELERLMDLADQNFRAWSKHSGPAADLIAQRLEVTFEEKVAYGLHHIGCINKSRKELADFRCSRRRERDRFRKRVMRTRRAVLLAAKPKDVRPLSYRAEWLLRRLPFGQVTISELAKDIFRTGPFHELGRSSLRKALHRAFEELYRNGSVERRLPITKNGLKELRITRQGMERDQEELMTEVAEEHRIANRNPDDE